MKEWEAHKIFESKPHEHDGGINQTETVWFGFKPSIT